jgi:hypothetical protein
MKIFGAKRNIVESRRLHTEKLYDLYSSPLFGCPNQGDGRDM